MLVKLKIRIFGMFKLETKLSYLKLAYSRVYPPLGGRIRRIP